MTSKVAPLTKSQLGELALDAAIEIDLATKHRPTSFNNLEEFLASVKTQIIEDDEDKLLRDETLYPYYSYALQKTSHEQIGGRQRFGAIISEMLGKHQFNIAKAGELTELKKFCLAFHEAIVSSMMSKQVAAIRDDERIR